METNKRISSQLRLLITILALDPINEISNSMIFRSEIKNKCNFEIFDTQNLVA